jgi:hypothetical protein
MIDSASCLLLFLRHHITADTDATTPPARAPGSAARPRRLDPRFPPPYDARNASREDHTMRQAAIVFVSLALLAAARAALQGTGESPYGAPPDAGRIYHTEDDAIVDAAQNGEITLPSEGEVCRCSVIARK